MSTYLLKLFLVLIGIASLIAVSGPECIDCQLTGSIEYTTILNYKTIDAKQLTSACTMVTQCSADRLHRLTKQVKAWGGTTSVAVYVSTAVDGQEVAQLKSIDSYLTGLADDPEYGGRLTVSILFGHESSPEKWDCKDPHAPGMPLYPINALRNLAVAAAGFTWKDTNINQYLFYVDVDFVPSAGLNDWINVQSAFNAGSESRPRDSLLHRLTNRGDLIVVPAFEDDGSIRPAPVKRSLRYLQQGVKNGAIRPFHVKRYAVGHSATDYTR